MAATSLNDYQLQYTPLTHPSPALVDFGYESEYSTTSDRSNVYSLYSTPESPAITVPLPLVSLQEFSRHDNRPSVGSNGAVMEWMNGQPQALEDSREGYFGPPPLPSNIAAEIEAAIRATDIASQIDIRPSKPRRKRAPRPKILPASEDGDGHPYAPRPMNKFMKFREWFNKHHTALNPEGSVQQHLLSKAAGQTWKKLSEEAKAYWAEQAQLERKGHNEMFPDYRYRPRRSPKTVDGVGKVKSPARARGRRQAAHPYSTPDHVSTPSSTTSGFQSFDDDIDFVRNLRAAGEGTSSLLDDRRATIKPGDFVSGTGQIAALGSDADVTEQFSRFTMSSSPIKLPTSSLSPTPSASHGLDFSPRPGSALEFHYPEQQREVVQYDSSLSCDGYSLNSLSLTGVSPYDQLSTGLDHLGEHHSVQYFSERVPWQPHDKQQHTFFGPMTFGNPWASPVGGYYDHGGWQDPATFEAVVPDVFNGVAPHVSHTFGNVGDAPTPGPSGEGEEVR